MVDIVKYMYLEVRNKYWKKICKKYKNQFSPDMNRKHQISRSSKHSQKLKAELKKHGEALHRKIDIIIHSKQAEIDDMDNKHQAALDNRKMP